MQSYPIIFHFQQIVVTVMSDKAFEEKNIVIVDLKKYLGLNVVERDKLADKEVTHFDNHICFAA